MRRQDGSTARDGEPLSPERRLSSEDCNPAMIMIDSDDTDTMQTEH
jgi:hypothetical protein